MKKCYINGLGCVSAQATTEETFWQNIVEYSQENAMNVLPPNYKAYISPVAIRRMSASVKNSVVAANLAKEEAKIEEFDAIITGTGLGCIADSENFLNKLLDNEEQYLTPTSFIQSTHNTVAGQIALGLKCKAYNLTYVNAGSSFPAALLDGLLKVQLEQKNALVGGVDEISDYTTRLYQLANYYKKPEAKHGSILEERTIGCIPGEGAAFFVLENKKTTSSYAELKDVHYSNGVEEEKLEEFTTSFLARNGITKNEIDLIILGNNGDVNFDYYYDDFSTIFNAVPKIYYKHLFGEFMSSPSIALWLAAKLYKEKEIPAIFFKKEEHQNVREIKHILIYNQYRGKDHSLMLLKNA